MGRVLDIDKLRVEVVFFAVNVVTQVVVSVEFGAFHLLHQFKWIDGAVVRNGVFNDVTTVFEALKHVLKQIIKAILAMGMCLFFKGK